MEEGEALSEWRVEFGYILKKLLFIVSYSLTCDKDLYLKNTKKKKRLVWKS